jgi:protein-S-isoprenylcysteine O-methyltransferase Ste14
MNIRSLVGSGEKVALVTLPFLVAGIAANLAVPTLFSVGGPPDALRWLSVVVLILGVAIWFWSAVLILVKVPRHELITSGPYALVRHPLYTDVALLVVPWVGFLLNTWLGVVIGLVMYLASRRFAPEEEATLARAFGPAWERYRAGVKAPWL